MRILANFPLECFESRDRLTGLELVTFGPQNRMVVDKVHFPFDVGFDPSTEHFRALWKRLPQGFEPDCVLLYWPDQDPICAGLEECPVPVIGVLSDYNLTFPFVTGLAGHLDLLLVDRPGVSLFERLDFAAVREFCQFSWKRPFHFPIPGVPRDIDIGFCGNLNPTVQKERAPWLQRVAALGAQGHRSAVVSGLFGVDYGQFLNRCKIVFNRSIRGEMNLRAFEAPRCGAVLFQEEGNTELADFLTPGEECVVYNDDNFEDLVAEYLADDLARGEIAAAGHEKINGLGFSARLPQLEQHIQNPGPGRKQLSRGELELGRGTAMLSTWGGGVEALPPLIHACRELPDDPRPWNALAIARTRSEGKLTPEVMKLLQRSVELDPGYIPAVFNAALLLVETGNLHQAHGVLDELDRRLGESPGFAQLDGCYGFQTFSAPSLAACDGLRAAVAAGDPAAALSHLRPDVILNRQGSKS